MGNSFSKNCTFLNFIQKSKGDYNNECRWKIDASFYFISNLILKIVGGMLYSTCSSCMLSVVVEGFMQKNIQQIFFVVSFFLQYCPVCRSGLQLFLDIWWKDRQWRGGAEGGNGWPGNHLFTQELERISELDGTGLCFNIRFVAFSKTLQIRERKS